MTVEETLEEMRSNLRAKVDSASREGSMNFFREPIDPYGVRSADLKPIVAAVHREAKRWSRQDRNRFCNLLWQSGKFEEGVIVCHLYKRFAKECYACEFRLFERWIDRYVHNWAHGDGVASWLIAAAVANEPALIEALTAWTESPNRWKRRAAAVGLLQEAKAGRNTEAIFRIASRLMSDSDDMVQKGVGWLLKEAYPKRPRETLAFLKKSKEHASRLILRYAAEKMSPAHRQEVLGKTPR